MWIVENLWINCRNIVYNWVIMWIIEKTLNYGEILKKKSLDGLKMIIYNCAWCVATIRKGGVYVWRWHSSLKRDRDLKFTVSEQEWALPAAEKFCRQEEQKAERNYPHNSAKAAVHVAFFCEISRKGCMSFHWKIGSGHLVRGVPDLDKRKVMTEHGIN